MSYKEEFKKRTGHAYEPFRYWLSSSEGLAIGDLTEDERELFVEKFQRVRRSHNFEEKNGFDTLR